MNWLLDALEVAKVVDLTSGTCLLALYHLEVGLIMNFLGHIPIRVVVRKSWKIFYTLVLFQRALVS